MSTPYVGLTVLCCGRPVTPTAEYQLPDGEWVSWAPATLGLPSDDDATSPALGAGAAVSGAAGFDDESAAQLGTLGAASDRARWFFRCATCKTEAPARAEKFQNLARILADRGESSVPLPELNGRLRKS